MVGGGQWPFLPGGRWPFFPGGGQWPFLPGMGGWSMTFPSWVVVAVGGQWPFCPGGGGGGRSMTFHSWGVGGFCPNHLPPWPCDISHDAFGVTPKLWQNDRRYGGGNYLEILRVKHKSCIVLLTMVLSLFSNEAAPRQRAETLSPQLGDRKLYSILWDVAQASTVCCFYGIRTGHCPYMTSKRGCTKQLDFLELNLELIAQPWKRFSPRVKHYPRNRITISDLNFVISSSLIFHISDWNKDWNVQNINGI